MTTVLPHALRAGLIALALITSAAHAQPFPLTVPSCGQTLRFDAPPKRAVFHDLNMTDMALALGLQAQMVGVSGVTGWYDVRPEIQQALAGIPELAPRQPSLENLLAARPDFFFAGWSYGMHPGGPVTPDTLVRHGIQTLVLTESCIRIDKNRPTASMALLYDDFIKLGAIFGKRAQAEERVRGWQARLAALPAPPPGPPPRVFLYDSGDASPFTAGRHAMPQALIAAAGGRNIMDDLPTSWGTTSWEVVATRAPEFILLLGSRTDPQAQRLIHTLRAHPVMRQLPAVRQQRFLVLRYEEITPGPANIDAIEKIAQALHALRAAKTHAH
ncbi:MAG: ABC transporter substrate-binding protein [Pseudomonadota bacterium]|nr:ABC transporter substrate-binding protein [Pseudomonadota bacterium]